MSIHHQYVEPLQNLTLDNGEHAVQVAFSAVEQLVSLNLGTARTVAEHGLASARRVAESRTYQEALEVLQDSIPSALQHAFDWSRAHYEITSRAHVEWLNRSEAILNDSHARVLAALEQAEAGAPVGSVQGIVAIRSALSATRDALDRFSETGKKVAELTDAHVAATANAVINGVSRQPTRAQRNVRKAA